MADYAQRVAIKIRQSKKGFLTLTKNALRDAFEIGKLTENQSTWIVDSLFAQGIRIHPHPYGGGNTVRLYDTRHPIGQMALSVLEPDQTTDAPIKRLADLLERDEARRDLKSVDVPWIEAFDIFLQSVYGRDPDGWEDLLDDRHLTLLARELAEALQLGSEISATPWLVKLAARVCSLRPRIDNSSVEELPADWEPDENVYQGFMSAIASRDRALREEHDRLLNVAARLIAGKEPPTHRVELGRLGLRRRNEVIE